MFLFTPISAFAVTIAEQAINFTSTGASPIGYLSFSLPSLSTLDIAASGGSNIDPQLFLLRGTSNFSLADVITSDDDGCLDIDCGTSSGASLSSLINDIPLTSGDYTVATSSFSLSADEAISGVRDQGAFVGNGGILVLVGDNNLIIPGTGTGTGSSRLISFTGLDIFPNIPSVLSQSPNQAFAMAAVNTICNSASTSASLLNDRCTELLGITTEQQHIVAGAITPAQINLMGSIAVATSQTISASGAYSRLTGLRTGQQKRGGMTFAGFNSRPVHVAAGDLPEFYKHLGVYINSFGSFGTKRKHKYELGYNFDNAGVSVGVDYAFTDQLLLGLAFDYKNTDADIAHNAGDVEVDSYTGSIYGAFNYNMFYVDGIFSIGHTNTEITRNIRYTTPTSIINTKAFGSTSAAEYKAAFSTGYNFFIRGFNISPFAGFNYSKTAVEGFNETGVQGWAVHYENQDMESITSSLGTRFSYTFNTKIGSILPQANVEWVHEYGYNQRVLRAQFVEDLTHSNFRVLSDKPDRDYMQAGFSLQGEFAHDISGFLGYDVVLLRENVSNHTFSASIRMQF